jgi:hypothetical protein
MSSEVFKCRGCYAELDSASQFSNVFNTETLNQIQGDGKL